MYDLISTKKVIVVFNSPYHDMSGIVEPVQHSEYRDDYGYSGSEGGAQWLRQMDADDFVFVSWDFNSNTKDTAINITSSEYLLLPDPQFEGQSRAYTNQFGVMVYDMLWSVSRGNNTTYFKTTQAFQL